MPRPKGRKKVSTQTPKCEASSGQPRQSKTSKSRDTAETNVEDIRIEQTVDGAAVQPFRFLDLPPEVRNMVYSYALAKDSKWDIEYTPVDRRRDRQTDVLGKRPKYICRSNGDKKCESIHLLATCRQVYNEAMPVLYSSASLTFNGTSSLEAFLQRQERSVAFVTHVTIVINWPSQDGRHLDRLLTASRLKTLEIHIVMDKDLLSRSCPSPSSIEKFIKTLHILLRGLIRTHGRVDLVLAMFKPVLFDSWCLTRRLHRTEKRQGVCLLCQMHARKSEREFQDKLRYFLSWLAAPQQTDRDRSLRDAK